MQSSKNLLGLTLLSAIGIGLNPAFAQEGQPAEASATKATSEESVFGAPLIINGERVPDLMIKRYLGYGSGRGILEMYKRQALIEDQIAIYKQEYAAEGKEWDEEKFICTEEDYNRAFDERVSKFAIQFPFLDLETELRRAYGSVELFERATRQTIQFDKVFLPQNPYEWPIVTVEALKVEADGAIIRDAYETYEKKKAYAEETGTEMIPESDVYMGYLRDSVEIALMDTIDARYFSHGIDPNLALWMDFNGDGEPELTVTVEQMYEELIPYLDEMQIEAAKLFCARIVTARQSLEREGLLMDKKEFDDYYESLAAQQGAFFTLESVAMYTDYFPSIEHFKAYFYMAESHRRSIEPIMEADAVSGERIPPVLREYLPIANKIMGLAKVEGEVLMVSAFDTPNYKWKEGGWEWAKKEVHRLKELYQENEAAWNAQKEASQAAAREGKPFDMDPNILEPFLFWTALREEYCEYWDAPPPMDGDGQSQQNKSSGSNAGYRHKGKWGPKTRHDLQTFVGESHYMHWLWGSSIADVLFFEQDHHTIAGPFRGPAGYYMTYLIERTPPTHPLRINEDRHVDLLKQGYGRHAWMQFSNEVLAEADIKGLKEY